MSMKAGMTGFIGGGNMAEGLIKGMVQAGHRSIMVSEPVAERRAYLASTYGVEATADSLAVAARCPLVVLAVKPQQMDAVMDALAPAITGDHTVVSIAAGITLAYYEARLKTKRIVRVMPNMGALKQQSMSVMSFCDCFAGAEVNAVRDVFMSAGRVIALPERLMDAVTALSGSGPAFIALFVDALIKAGVSLGLPEDAARELALQTLNGTAALLDDGLAPEKLIAMVRSPGGTTAEGLKVLEERGAYETVRLTLEAAARRSAELARQ
jgi:pyrroline-5-carboxylate reductase